MQLSGFDPQMRAPRTGKGASSCALTSVHCPFYGPKALAGGSAAPLPSEATSQNVEIPASLKPSQTIAAMVVQYSFGILTLDIKSARVLRFDLASDPVTALLPFRRPCLRLALKSANG